MVELNRESNRALKPRIDKPCLWPKTDHSHDDESLAKVSEIELPHTFSSSWRSNALYFEPVLGPYIIFRSLDVN